jgi:hypothetical protein
MVQLSWFWLLHQPDSNLSRWFHERVKLDGGRRKKVTIIALARKLLIAVWKFARHGVVIEGAILRPPDKDAFQFAGTIEPADPGKRTDTPTGLKCRP